MRAVIQRVLEASVKVEGVEVSKIGRGLLVLLGVGGSDSEQDARYLAEKTANLRIFPDPADRMNLSVLDIEGEILVISQFTLYGDCRKGRRPSYGSDGRARSSETALRALRRIPLRTYPQGPHRALSGNYGGLFDKRGPGDPASGQLERFLRTLN